jgi:hypothetical protein
MARDDPENAEREFGASFIPFGSSVFFPREVLAKCTKGVKSEARRAGPGEVAAVGGDLGLTRDAAAFVAVHRVATPTVAGRGSGPRRAPEPEDRPLPRGGVRSSAGPSRGAPAEARRARPARLRARPPATGSAACSWTSGACRPAREHLPKGFSLETDGADEADLYAAALELMKAGAGRNPRRASSELLRQLPLVMSKPKPGGGLKIILPRKFGSHCDLVPAFVKAAVEGEGAAIGWTASQPKGGRQRQGARTGGY